MARRKSGDDAEAVDDEEEEEFMTKALVRRGSVGEEDIAREGRGIGAEDGRDGGEEDEEGRPETPRLGEVAGTISIRGTEAGERADPLARAAPNVDGRIEAAAGEAEAPAGRLEEALVAIYGGRGERTRQWDHTGRP